MLNVLNKDELKLNMFEQTMVALTNIDDKGKLTENVFQSLKYKCELTESVVNSLEDKEKQLVVLNKMITEYEERKICNISLIIAKSNVLLGMGRGEEALKELEELGAKGLLASPHLEEQEVHVLVEMGKKEEALKILNKLPGLNVNLIEQKVNLLFDKKGAEVQAIDLMDFCEKSIGIKFGDIPLQKKAKALLQMGNKEEALLTYEEIYDRNPKNRKIINTVKKLSDEVILADALSKKIDKVTLEKLDTVDFDMVKDEDLTKLLNKLGDINIGLGKGSKKIEVFFQMVFNSKGMNLAEKIKEGSLVEKISDKVYGVLQKREGENTLTKRRTLKLANVSSKGKPIELKMHNEILHKLDENHIKSNNNKGLENSKDTSFNKKGKDNEIDKNNM